MFHVWKDLCFAYMYVHLEACAVPVYLAAHEQERAGKISNQSTQSLRKRSHRKSEWKFTAVAGDT